MNVPVQSSDQPSQGSSQRDWLRLTIGAACAVTFFDAYLLERKKSFFGGGFLTVDHLRSVPEVVMFAGGSLLADAAVVGLLVAIGLWLTRRINLKPIARLAAVMAVALAPFVIADFIFYQLLTYLGDAFDTALMFDLAGRRSEEFLAVASSHLMTPLALVAAGSLFAAVIIWTLNRFAPGTPAPLVQGLGARSWRWAVSLFLVGLCSTALLRAGSDVMDNGLSRKPSGKLLGFIAEEITDVDRDGFGAIGRMSDPAPFTAAISPYAIDIPGNGVDENGVGGDLPSTSAAYDEPSARPPAWISKPNIILFVLESFRADAVGAILNGHDVTPTLSALGRAGISSDLAFSHNGYTAQSRYHLFSGSLAGLRDGASLIDDFKANGYEVAYFSGQDESWGGSEFGIGFDRADFRYDARVEPHRRYSTFTTAGSLAVPLEVVLEHVNTFLSARRSTQPLLVYVNFHDTHFPYHHAGVEPLVSATALQRRHIGPSRHLELRETYLNTAANVDRAIASVLTAARRSLSGAPGVIVTSDHGESLYDEGFLGHGYALNEVQTRIPLIVSGVPLQITEPFGQVDLRDTVRAALSGRTMADLPNVSKDPAKHVFQYLGNLARPRQIAFVTTGGRTVYDFGTARVRLRDGAWRRPSDLSDASLLEFRELVHYWESAMLARTRRR